MNFPDLLTGFMETWPAWLAPRPLVEALKRYEISLPSRYGVDGVLTVSDTLADFFAERGFPREKILPIYYGYDAEKFPFRARPAPAIPPVVVMHGSFDAHHLGPIAFDAIRSGDAAAARNRFPVRRKKNRRAGRFFEPRAETNSRIQIRSAGFRALRGGGRNTSPTRAWASCLTRNPPERTARLSPRWSNTSPADCPPWPRRSKASGAIFKTTRWCVSRNSTARISGRKSSVGSMNRRRRGRSRACAIRRARPD